MNDAIAVEHLTDEDIFLYTQRKRIALVEKMVEKDLPTDTTEQGIFLATLNDIDKQVVSRRKLQLDEKVADAAGAVADTMEQLFGVFGNKSPLAVTEIPVAERRPELPEKLIDIQLVPGELEIGTRSVELRDFEDDA